MRRVWRISRKRVRPGRGPTPGLVRVPGGWRATARLPAGPINKKFNDAHHGSPSAARAAAEGWRAGQLRIAGVPDAAGRRVVLVPRTASGVVGVYLRPARTGASAGWTATFELADGSRLQRVWSVRLHGHTRAVAFAIAQREAWEIAALGSALPKSTPGFGSDNGDTTMSAPNFLPEQLPSPPQLAPPPTDDELLRQWLDVEVTGETYIAIYVRYRPIVRDELERGGLAPLEAENRVGSVFIRAADTRDTMPDDVSLRDRFLAVAREVAADTSWSPPV